MPGRSQIGLDSLIAHLPGTVYRCRNDRDWTVEFISEGCRALTGYEPADLIGNARASYGRDVIHPDDQEACWRAVQAAIADGLPFQAQYRVVARSGEIRWVRESGNAIRGPSGEVEALEGFITDITEQMTAQAELERSRQLLDTVVNTTPIGINAKDAEGRYFFINRYQIETFDLVPTDIVGLTPAHVWGDEAGEHFMSLDRIVVTTGTSLGPYEEKAPDKDGIVRRWLVTKTPIKDPNGSVSGIVTTSVDVTERVAAEQQLRHAHKMEAVGSLTAGVAHDFNNLLTVILGGADDIQSRLLAGEPVGTAIDAIVAAGERARDLIRRLLAVVRLQPLTPVEVELDRLVDDVGELLRATLGGNTRVETVRSRSLWRSVVDPAELHAALLNLAINGRDAMPEGGLLRLEAENLTLAAPRVDEAGEIPAGDWVRITVTDEGIGMTPDVMQRAFDPFFTTKPAGVGTGLGLSMVRGFVEQSGGHVRIRSRPGAGTAVEVYLPRFRGNEARSGGGAHAAPGGPDAMPRGREAVLVVEDDPLVRDHVAMQLRALGYSTLSAADGREAIAVLESDRPIDLLFTDVVMPGGISGPELAAEAARIRPGLPVLFASGYADPAVVEPGAIDCLRLLSKPYRRLELARAVRSALDRGRTPS